MLIAMADLVSRREVCTFHLASEYLECIQGNSASDESVDKLGGSSQCWRSTLRTLLSLAKRSGIPSVYMF